MNLMEQRAWITINNFPAHTNEYAWEPFITRLEHDANGYGPILSWDDEHTAVIVMSADVDQPADLAVFAISATATALRTAGLGDLYPSGVRIEPAIDGEPIAA